MDSLSAITVLYLILFWGFAPFVSSVVSTYTQVKPRTYQEDVANAHLVAAAMFAGCGVCRMAIISVHFLLQEQPK